MHVINSSHKMFWKSWPLANIWMCLNKFLALRLDSSFSRFQKTIKLQFNCRSNLNPFRLNWNFTQTIKETAKIREKENRVLPSQTHVYKYLHGINLHYLLVMCHGFYLCHSWLYILGEYNNNQSIISWFN